MSAVVPSAACPHDFCPHASPPFSWRCVPDCIMADVEPLAVFHNRCEVAAEAGGGKVERRCECRLDSWADYSAEVLEKVQFEERL